MKKIERKYVMKRKIIKRTNIKISITFGWNISFVQSSIAIYQILQLIYLFEKFNLCIFIQQYHLSTNINLYIYVNEVAFCSLYFSLIRPSIRWINKLFLIYYWYINWHPLLYLSDLKHWFIHHCLINLSIWMYLSNLWNSSIGLAASSSLVWASVSSSASKLSIMSFSIVTLIRIQILMTSFH